MIKESFFTRLLAFIVLFLSAGAFSINADVNNPTLQLLVDKVNALRDEVRQMRSGQKDGSGPLVDEQFTQDVVVRRSAITGAVAVLLTPGIEQAQAQNALSSLKEIFEQVDAALKKASASVSVENNNVVPAPVVEQMPAPAQVAEQAPVQDSVAAQAPSESPATPPVAQEAAEQAPEQAAAPVSEQASAPAPEASTPAPAVEAPAVEAPAKQADPVEQAPVPAQDVPAAAA